ncbi:hypothetical protein [Neorhizobium sp. T7_12]|uniref:hypothetical protein n=1 Tax=Neorhizobium sp. T7_12 TaxID=2093832 RepID=UPI000CFA3BE2|nr:hypothetical protein [Neorhizobium sp. T7_12]
MAVTKHDSFETFTREYHRYRSLLIEALKHSHGHTIEQIDAGLINRDYQFWTTDNACAVTSLTEWQGKSVCCFFLVAGNKSRALLEIFEVGLPSVEEYARSHGCEGVLGIGRAGWSRITTAFGFTTHKGDDETIYFKGLA